MMYAVIVTISTLYWIVIGAHHDDPVDVDGACGCVDYYCTVQNMLHRPCCTGARYMMRVFIKTNVTKYWVTRSTHHEAGRKDGKQVHAVV